MRRISCFVAVMIGVASPAGAIVRVAPLVKAPPLHESLAPDPVEGPVDAIFGLTVDRLTDPVSYPQRRSGDPQVGIEGLTGADRAVCVTIRRAQGGYRATFRSQVPRGASRIQIPFDSSDEARTRLSSSAVRSAEMAVSARANCAPNAPLLPTSWSPRRGEGRYALLVGGSAYGLPAIRVDGGPVIDCQRLSKVLSRKDMGNNIYGFACPFELITPRCRPDHSIKVLWFDGAAISKEAIIAVRHGCA